MAFARMGGMMPCTRSDRSLLSSVNTRVSAIKAALVAAYVAEPLPPFCARREETLTMHQDGSEARVSDLSLCINLAFIMYLFSKILDSWKAR